MEKLSCLYISSSEWQVLMFVIRKTYGWHKKEDNISLTQFQKGTGLSRPTVIWAIKQLVRHALLVVKRNGLVNRYGFQKDHDKWGSRLRLTSKAQRTSAGKFQRTSASKAQRTHKRKIKENIKENTTKVVSYGNSELNNLLEFAKTLKFPLQGSERINRFNAWNFLRKHGLEESKKLVKMACAVRGLDYAPVINDFIQLYRKDGDLVTYFQKQLNQKGVKNYDQQPN